MPRQPFGAGAAVRSPSGAAARASAPSPSSPLPPKRYRALRARYNALLVTLYERTNLTVREIAAAAGRTERAVQLLVRELGCLPRNARTCRPGTDVGARRAGERPPPLNGPATRRTVAAFAGVARELAASAQMRAADDLQRATARAARRSTRAQSRVMTGAARSLSQIAASIEDTAALRDALEAPPKRRTGRLRARQAGPTPKQLREERLRAQERVRLEVEARMYEAHAMRRAKLAAGLAAAATPPPHNSDSARRIGGIADHDDAERRQQPRIRRVW